MKMNHEIKRKKKGNTKLKNSNLWFCFHFVVTNDWPVLMAQ